MPASPEMTAVPPWPAAIAAISRSIAASSVSRATIPPATGQVGSSRAVV
jgi:hypothetical protein